jgi:hypothetical protein
MKNNGQFLSTFASKGLAVVRWFEKDKLLLHKFKMKIILFKIKEAINLSNEKIFLV